MPQELQVSQAPITSSVSGLADHGVPSTFFAVNGNLAAYRQIQYAQEAASIEQMRGLAAQGYEVRSLAPLLRDANRLIDAALLRVGRDRLSVVDAMLGAGLTFSLSGWLGITELYREKISDGGTVTHSMEPFSRGQENLPERTPYQLPVYCTFGTFSLGIRLLTASQRSGSPLDTEQFEQLTRRINEATEVATISGPGVVSNSLTVPGLINETNVNTQAFVDNEAWTASGHSGEDILTDIKAMRGKNIADKYFGPYVLIIPTAYEDRLNDDYSTSTSTVTTIRDRVMKLSYISDIIVADRMPTDTVVLMQMTSNVAELIIGQGITPITWMAPNGSSVMGALLACTVPAVKSDYNGGSGICVGTPAG